ncbi:MAG: hypothetical protein ACRDI2_04460 [Chloroflexota bacterium]
MVLKGAPRLTLRVMQRYRIMPYPDQPDEWKVSTAAYLYALETADGHEVLSYHWQPEEAGEVIYPHLHLGPAGATGGLLHRKLHLPTGRIALEDVLRLAITQMGVEPARRDWAKVLDETQARFEVAQTWATSSGKPSR